MAACPQQEFNKADTLKNLKVDRRPPLVLNIALALQVWGVCCNSLCLWLKGLPKNHFVQLSVTSIYTLATVHQVKFKSLSLGFIGCRLLFYIPFLNTFTYLHADVAMLNKSFFTKITSSQILSVWDYLYGFFCTVRDVGCL